AFDARVRRQTRRTRRTLSVPVAERTRGASSALALPWPALLPGTSRLRSPCRAWLPAARTEKPCTLQTPRKFAGRLGQRGRRRRARTRQTVLYTACPRKKRRVTRPSHEPRVSRQRRGPRRRRPGCLGSRQLLEKRRPKGPAPLLDHRLAKRSTRQPAGRRTPRSGCGPPRSAGRWVYSAQLCDAVAGHASGPSTVSGTIMLAPNWASTSAWLLHQPSYTCLDIGSGKM